MDVARGDNEARWIFPPDRLTSTPSIKRGITEDEELLQRQHAATLIRRIGIHLKDNFGKPSTLSMYTAMVYMHRFYVFHSFQKYPALKMAPAALFLAAKVEETPIRLEYIIKTTHMIQGPSPSSRPLNIQDKIYEELQQELIKNENLLLQTLGFDLIVTAPHTSVITCGEMVKAPKTVTKLAYELATNSLHFTTMCLKYRPTTVACICLHMAFKSFNLQVQRDEKGRDWWNYTKLDANLKMESIDQITIEFVSVIERCKKSFNKWVTVKSNSGIGTYGSNTTAANSTD